MLRWLSLIAVAAMTASCDGPKIERAWLTSAGDSDAVIHVSAPERVAQYIKANQVYFNIVIEECSGSDNRYPLEAYIQGKRASGFDFDIPKGDAEFTASSPMAPLTRYKKPCASFEGGSYLGSRIKTNKVPIAR